jgi:nondiscriminating aspartyl-tRNA synthetase
MSRIRTIDAQDHIGERVTLNGWLHALRRIGRVSFIVLRDGWGTLQAVTDDPADLAPLIDASSGAFLQPETVLSVEGTLVATSQADGRVELHDPAYTVISPVSEPLPVIISKRKLNASLPTLLDHAVVANRHLERRAIFKLAASAMRGFREALMLRDFTEIQTPKIVASATESGANVFKIDYFGRPAYLAQSPQFYKQIMVGVFERVFEVGPVFRAEPHDTARHVNEYVSLDAEFGFIEDHFTVMALLRDALAHIMLVLTRDCGPEIALSEAVVPHVPTSIPHIHFADAKQLAHELHGGDERDKPDLSPQEEQRLGAWAQRELGSDFLFVTGYPMRKRPFYTHPDPRRPEFSNSFDLLFRGTELVTGGQRLHRYADYLSALNRANYPVEPFESYLEAFRFGMPPHGGFAIGLERLLMQLLGTPNLRLTTLFPRDIARVAP